MADVPNPAIGPQGLIPTTTVTTSGPDITKKQMAPEGQEALQNLAAAQNARVAAQTAPVEGAPTVEDLNAEIAQARANATGSEQDIALAKQARDALVDPFAPAEPEDLSPQRQAATPEQAQDATAAFVAEQKAREQAAFATKQAELHAELERMQAQTRADINARAEEYRRAGAEKTSFEDPSFFTRIMRALALGLGAYGAGLAGGPNHAANIINAQWEQEKEAKRQKIETALERYKQAGVQPERLRQWYDDQMKNLLATQKAQLDNIDLTSQKILARYPQAQKAAAQKVAEMKAENAKDIATFALANTGRTVQQEGKKVQEVTGKTPTGQSVSDAEAKKATYGTQILSAVDTIEGSRRLTDDELKQLNDNVRDMRAAGENATKGLSGPKRVEAMQALGLSADSLTKDIPEDVKPVAVAMLTGAGLIIRDQSGAAITNYEDLNNSMQRLPQPGEGDKMYAAKVRGLRQYGESLVKLAGPGAQARLGITPEGKPVGKSTAQAAPPAPGPSPVPPPRSKEERNHRILQLKGADRGKAVKALNLKPSDPRYKDADTWLRRRGLR